mgnify:CR=1 FL=1
MKSGSVILLVSCGRRKSSVPCQAKEMYNSFRFQQIKTIAENLNLKWYIMSAKYGLLNPESVIEPYDMCLTQCSDEYQQKWAQCIVSKFVGLDKNTTFAVIANDDYSRNIVPLLVAEGFSVIAPFIQKNEEEVAYYMQRSRYVEDVKSVYKCISQLAEKTGGIRVLNECNGRMYWPQRGVYFFVDFQEQSVVSSGFPRIVRVGTHAVSKGSKTTLWDRLKTHKGTEKGDGNHRGSIFRLHVGNAIINRDRLLCDTWGIGQNAKKDIREKEKYIEQLVSDYIGQLGVVVLDIDDMPCATSDRAYVEKNAIALLSSINSSFNFSTLNWLGNWNPRDEIKDSCLWNINYINSDYDSNFLDILEQYASKTIKSFNK